MDEKTLVKLVKELHDLGADNRRFLETRFTSPSSSGLTEYKEIIREALNPSIYGDCKVEFATAKKAISSYRKASGDDHGLAELMMYYVETANRFTLDYGDMWEQFYASVESMYKRVLTHLLKMHKSGKDISRFKERAHKVMTSTEHIGWGYHDALTDYYYSVFPGDA